MCVCVCLRQRQSECLCIWASGGGRAIICSKLLAGRGEVGETVIQKESKGWRESEGGGEDKWGRNELAREKKYRQTGKTRREGGRSRGESRAEWIRAAYECSTATVRTVLSPLPPIVIPGSVGASKAANSSDIYAAFSALQWRKPGRSLCQHPQWPQVDERWWMVQTMDYSTLTGARPMKRPFETLWEPRSCILCYIIQYVLNKIGLVWVEE